MKLKLENIGKIANAEIIINNLTVIAGPNNTGKSTLSKALYSSVNSMQNYGERVKRDILRSIAKKIDNEINEAQEANINSEDTKTIFFSKNNRKRVLEDFLSSFDLHDEDLFIENIVSYLKREDLPSDTELIKKIKSIITRYKDTNNKEILERLSYRIFSDEFGNEIKTADSKESGRISINIRDSDTVFEFTENEFNIDNPVNLSSNAIYIDDKDVLTSGIIWNLGRNALPPRGHTDELRRLFEQETRETATDEVITDGVLKEIYSKLGSVLSIESREEKETSSFKSRKYFDKKGFEVDVENISDGLKTFILLDTLLKNGSLKKNSILIFDEPEIHLHPEWQIVLAELIILIQQAFSMHMLVITHSPYFLNAIEVFSKKYKIADSTNYYLTQNNDGDVSLSNVNDSLGDIYDLLSRPFQTLEDIEYDEGF